MSSVLVVISSTLPVTSNSTGARTTGFVEGTPAIFHTNLFTDGSDVLSLSFVPAMTLLPFGTEIGADTEASAKLEPFHTLPPTACTTTLGAIPFTS